VAEVLKTGGRYKEVAANLKVKEVWHEADRYIVCYNPEEAERDRRAREEMVEKLQKALEEKGVKSLIGNSGYRRFLNVRGSEVSINYHLLDPTLTPKAL